MNTSNKSNASSLQRRGTASVVLPALLAGAIGCGAALANPAGMQVVSGQASASTQGGVLSVTSTPGAILHWQEFSINAGETTRFIQQSADSSVLNRIVGQDPTRIFGALQSNGRVFLINPNGILFGAGARVDVNGLAASTLDLADADFRAGRLHFSAGTGTGKLRNQGEITTPAGGRVVLIAHEVDNSGIISAPDGQVLLAAGHSVRLADASDPNLHVVLSAPGEQALNLGRIIAQGGRVGIFGALARQDGIVEADSAVLAENGTVRLLSQRDPAAFHAAATALTPAQCRLAPATPGCKAVLASFQAATSALVTQLLNVRVSPIRRPPVLVVRPLNGGSPDRDCMAAPEPAGDAPRAGPAAIACTLR